MNHPIGVSPYCIECENRTHWIELLFVDEHNQPFNRIKGEVVDASGAKFKVTLSDSPLVLSALAPGPIKITFENTSWLKETQKRTPRQDSDKDTVPERLKTKGHKGAKKKAVNAVTGDFVQLETDQVLPVQHEANSADVIDLITDNSYVITIKGFNYITLRIGMFFDGTCNNTYSSLWGYQQLVSYYHTWKICRDADIKKQYGQGTPISSYLLQQMKATDFGEEVFELPSKISFYHSIACNDDGHTHFEDVKSSAANELTNVQKMYDFYSEDKFTKETNTFIHKEYITGVGTGNDVIFAPAKEDFVLGTGLGVGDNGIEGKVKQGITQLCASLTGTNTHRKKNDFNNILKSMSDDVTIDGICSLEFDVFGFSRGAAAGRHFIHHILDAENKETFQQIESAIKDVNLPLMVGFDWADSDNCCINFAGIMDTVAAVTELWKLDVGANDDNGDVKLALCKDPLRLRKAIHFTAHPQYEYRSNFGLNLFNKSAQFEEYKLFGCHSDIGGGYYSLESFPYDDYLLPVLEDKKVFGGGMSSLSKQAIVNSMNRILEKEKKIGWLTEDYKQVIQKYTVGKKKDEMWKGIITSKRITNGNLSRLYLRFIYGLAHFNNVPLEDYWDKDIIVDHGLGQRGSIYPLNQYITLPVKLQPFGDAILKDAMNGEVDDFIFGEKFKKYLLVNRMIHHSSDNGMVNKPSYNSDEDYYRYLYECKE